MQDMIKIDMLNTFWITWIFLDLTKYEKARMPTYIAR